MRLLTKNWTKFQHYGLRRPPWIKLHRGLLEDYAFFCLPIASKALAPMLWLLASEHEEGIIEGDTAQVAFRLRMSEKELLAALKPLIQNGFFEDASIMLASGERAATSEGETETEGDTENPPVVPLTAKRACQMPEGFAPTADHYALARSLNVNMDREFVAFSDYHRSKGSTFKDWSAALRTWLRNSQRWGNARRVTATNMDTRTANYSKGVGDDGAF